jgi:ABC-type transport system involved in multi-copper enzyme maturation permease subunit
MSTTALTTSRQQTHALRRPNPFVSVLAWELLRFRASRLFWVQALGFFGLLLFVIWVGRTPEGFRTASQRLPFTGFVAGTSAWGLLETLPPGLLLLLCLLLPFVNADGAARDLQRRTHELLMTTALPNRAYVWGRYLAGALISLGLAVLLLVAILGMGELLHLTVADYPAPPLGAVLLLWAGMVVPATVLVGCLSFTLGTAFPRHATLVKVGILIAWFVGAVAIPPSGPGGADLPAWYSAWDPTSAATAQGLIQWYHPEFGNQALTATSTAQLQQILVAVENTVPDVASWLGPHLIEGGLSLLLVALAALTFRRFRGVFGE